MTEDVTGELTCEAAAALLYAEALCLDERRWADWLAMYAEDAVFWVPAWKSEAEPTVDPDAEISLIYYRGRSGLEDRVWRLKSGQSLASAPLRRTAHLVSNVQVTERLSAAEATVKASFAVHNHDPRGQTSHVFFGLYDYGLRLSNDGWKIARKRILLLNDHIPAVADVYML